MPDEDTQVLDTTSTSDEQDIDINLDDTIDEGDVAQPKTYSEQEFKQVLARAKKAEAENKALKTPKKPEPTQTITNNPEIDLDRRILKSQGMSDELIKEAELIAKVRGISLLDVKKDPVFIAIEKQKEDEEKSKKASLPPSRGSAQVKPKKDFNSPGLSEEERKELWMEKFKK